LSWYEINQQELVLLFAEHGQFSNIFRAIVCSIEAFKNIVRKNQQTIRNAFHMFAPKRGNRM
ncbi:MAG: hypothetical protein AAF738_08430, partial [Bacteroidota bacterium]